MRGSSFRLCRLDFFFFSSSPPPFTRLSSVKPREEEALYVSMYVCMYVCTLHVLIRGSWQLQCYSRMNLEMSTTSWARVWEGGKKVETSIEIHKRRWGWPFVCVTY